MPASAARWQTRCRPWSCPVPAEERLDRLPEIVADEVPRERDRGQPTRIMLVSPGRPGCQTATGLFTIRAKVIRQNMSGLGYLVTNVPNVEYFNGGHALHGRYWTLPARLGATSEDVDENGAVQTSESVPEIGSGPNSGVAFGIPSSHGCLGLQADDAAWLYGVTSVGTPDDAHY